MWTSLRSRSLNTDESETIEFGINIDEVKVENIEDVLNKILMELFTQVMIKFRLKFLCLMISSPGFILYITLIIS